MLSNGQVEFYRNNGFVIVPNFFGPDEVQAMQLEVERFKREGLGRNVNPGDKVNYQIMPLHDKSSLMRSLLFNQRVLEALTQLLGTEDICRWLDQIFLKPARHGSGTEWHQDNAYFNVPDARRGMGMWIAVHDASKANGTMEMIPNSEDLELAYHRSEGSDHHITAMGVDETHATPVEVEAGGLVFFNFGILHCTRANETDRDRAGLAYHFLAQDGMPPSAAGREATVVSGAGCTGGQSEYGETIAGTWDTEVSAVLGRER